MSAGNTRPPSHVESIPLESLPDLGVRETIPTDAPASFLPNDEDISSVLHAIRAALKEGDRYGEAFGGAAHNHAGANLLARLADSITQLQDDLITTLYSDLAALRVDTQPKLTLRLTDEARLILASEHPQGEQISALLASRPEYAAVFTEIAVRSAVLRNMRSLYLLSLYAESADCYAALASDRRGSVYQLSLMGEMNHFYFTQ